MTTLSVKIDASKFNKWLDSAPQKIGIAISNVIKKASFAVERESKIKSPVDTGRLRSSISTFLLPLKATIQPHVNYAIYVHDGTKYMTGRPFMSQALDIVERDISSFVNEELKTL